MQKCPHYARLASNVENLLQKLRETTHAQLITFQENNSAKFTALDEAVEQLIGEKEQAIGAMREHAKEHGCQRTV